MIYMKVFQLVVGMIAKNIRIEKMKLTTYLFAALTIFLASCTSEWQPTGSILLEGVSPIGMVIKDGEIWISDGDHNRVIIVDRAGAITKSFDEVDRPMHIEVRDDAVLVPSYMSDAILIFENDKIDTLEVLEELEAPAAISSSGDQFVIADFYNNRIVTNSGNEWKGIGKKGKGELEFNYPTDVQIFGDKIYVADAYNNRIQVLSMKGEFLNYIGEDQKMNAATGLFVNEKHVMITDFEHDRVLIFSHQGKLQQIIEKGLNKPTDIIVHEGEMFVTNYAGQYISIYEYN